MVILVVCHTACCVTTESLLFGRGKILETENRYLFKTRTWNCGFSLIHLNVIDELKCFPVTAGKTGNCVRPICSQKFERLANRIVLFLRFCYSVDLLFAMILRIYNLEIRSCCYVNIWYKMMPLQGIKHELTGQASKASLNGSIRGITLPNIITDTIRAWRLVTYLINHIMYENVEYFYTFYLDILQGWF